MKKAQLTILILSFAICLSAQERVRTFSHWAPAMYQPSSVAWDNTASLSYLNNTTYLGSDISCQTNIFFGEHPFVHSNKGRRVGGIGIHVIRKEAASDLLEATHAGVSLAYNLAVAKSHFIDFGLQGVMNQTKTSLERFTTGSQWLANEFRFDPTAHIGETISKDRVQYASVNAGLSWIWHDELSGKINAIAGFSAFDLNTPNVTFFNARNEVSRSVLLHVGGQLYHNKRWDAWSQIFYKTGSGGRSIYTQINTKIYFSNDNPYDLIRSGSLDLLCQYDWRNSLMTGIALHQTGFSVAFGYNFGLSTTSAARPFRNGTDVSIRLSKVIWKKKPSVIVIQGTPVGTKRTMDFTQPREANSGASVQVRTDVDMIQENIHDLSNVNSVRFELDKDFKYSFGKSELSVDARQYLDELAALLLRNPEYRLEVIGHTDNVGKPMVNYRLSAMRAKVVTSYLVGKGLSPERLTHAGRGDTEPLAPNDTEENRAKNRRVHFVISVNR